MPPERLASASAMHDPQTEVPLEQIEIAIVMQQRQAVHETTCRDEGIDRPADRRAECSETAVVSRCLDRQVRAADHDLLESAEQTPGRVESPIAGKALQDFGENQIPYEN